MNQLLYFICWHWVKKKKMKTGDSILYCYIFFLLSIYGQDYLADLWNINKIKWGISWICNNPHIPEYFQTFSYWICFCILHKYNSLLVLDCSFHEQCNPASAGPRCKVIIEKSRGGRFLWNRNWDLVWIWADYELL